MASIRQNEAGLSEKIPSVLLFLAKLLTVSAVVLFLLEYTCFYTRQDGSSMEPTVPKGSAVFINRLSYLWSEPHRYDVAAFYDEKEDRILVKRIIGLPGETVQILSGEIIINGVRLIDKDIYPAAVDIPGLAAGEVVLGPDEYFVLGDNPSQSQDSRFESTGNVSGDSLRGTAWLRYEAPFGLKLLNH